MNFQHTHEFFPSLAAGKLHAINRKVTYHDPCIMGRHMGIYDEPRELISSVPGVELVEMYSNREHALCCGAGGGVLSAFTDLAGDVGGRTAPTGGRGRRRRKWFPPAPHASST